MTSSDLRENKQEDANIKSASASATETVEPSSLAASDTATSTAPVAATFPGELLRAAREKAGLSIGDVSTRLRMAVRQVEAMEKADYANLPTGTFLRGFIRNYAKLVHVDQERVITLLEQTHKIAAVPKAAPISAPNPDVKINIDINKREMTSPKVRLAMVVLVILLLAAAVAYWWQYIRPTLSSGIEPAKSVASAAVSSSLSSALPSPSASASASPSITADATALPVALPDNAQPIPLPDGAGAVSALPINDAAPLTTKPGESIKTALVAQPNTQPDTQPNTQPNTQLNIASARLDAAIANPSTGQASRPVSTLGIAPVLTTLAANIAASPASKKGVIGFTFAGDSWVEVTDATGNKVLSRRYKAGDADEVAGRAPFSVIIGKAPVTRMAYNGREVNLAPHTKLAVARVTVK